MKSNNHPQKPRMNTSESEKKRTSFNPNFYRENPNYKPNSRKSNGENVNNAPSNSEEKNYNRRETSDYNRYPQRGYNSENRHENRNFNSYHKRDGNSNYAPKPYNKREDGNSNHAPKSYNRGEGGNSNYAPKPYNKGAGGNSNYAPKSYNRGEDGNSNYAKKPYSRGEGGNSNHAPKSYNRGEDGNSNHAPKSYNRREDGNSNYAKKPYGRGEGGSNFKSKNPQQNNKYDRQRQPEYGKQNFIPTGPMRLNRFLANSNICSRREADEFIEAGVVSVNGEIVTQLGVKITPYVDKVLFHDQLVSLEKKVYILLNKPKNVVTTTDDPEERKTVMDLVQNACRERIYPVGRLDRNTTGVLLITNDGDLAAKLAHPAHNCKKIYQVKLDRDFENDDMQKLLDGVTLEDGEISVDQISFVKEDDHSVVGVEVHSGKNRIVRRLFEHLQYKILSLDRVYFAGLTKKNLPRGKWRYLSDAEVNILKMSS